MGKNIELIDEKAAALRLGKTELIDEKAAAQHLGLKRQTLANLRHVRKPPNYVKIGKRVLYDRAVLDEFINARRVNLGE